LTILLSLLDAGDVLGPLDDEIPCDAGVGAVLTEVAPLELVLNRDA